MPWIYLFLAGLLEIVWAIGLKTGGGLARWPGGAITLAAMAASMALLGLALRDLPVGLAYAAWTGIGIVGTTLFGILALGEVATPFRLLCVALIVVGIAGLKLSPA